jgi:hypothetical protein
MINNASNKDEDFIGKIMRIVSIKEAKTKRLILLTEVRWYY